MTNINVLIYSGPGVGDQCFPGTKRALDQANIPGYTFTYNTNTVINDSTIQGFDVVFLPGGEGASKMYRNNPNINPETLKKIGTVGICSGAYIQAKEVIEPDETLRYTAWGICPHTSAINYEHEGQVSIRLSDDGEAVLGKSGTITMDHENGPAFKLSSGVPMAYYVGGVMDGKPAIIMDTDGNYNHVLSGPHPELSPFYPDILGNMVVAAYLGNKGGNKMEYTINDIANKSNSIATFIKTYKRLPNYSDFNGNQITMAEYLYLAVSAIINIYNNQTSNITYKPVKDATAPNASYTPGKQIVKTEYVQVAKNIQNYILKNGKAPNYATSSIGKLATNDLVFNYSLILAFYHTSGRQRLPNYVTVNQISGSSNSTSDIVQRIKDETGKAFNNFSGLFDHVKRYGIYCNPMYLDDQKSFNQAQVCVINEFNGIYDPDAYVQSPISGEWTRRDCMTCVDWTQWGMKVAKAMGYDVIPYGVYCPVYEINHALFMIKGNEFSDWTIIDLAAAAAEGYPIGSHWCNVPTADRAWPGWIPLE